MLRRRKLDGMHVEITEVSSELERQDIVSTDQTQTITQKMERKKHMFRGWQIQKVPQKLVTSSISLKHSTFLGESMFNNMEKEPDDGTPFGADVCGLDEDQTGVDATEETFDSTKIVVWNANARRKPL